MAEEKEVLNLYQKLAKIRSIADVAVKDKKGFNYSYADIAQILASVKSGMKKYGVSLIPMITPNTAEVSQLVTVNSKFTKTGEPYEQKTSEMLFRADMVFRWIDDENPSDCLDVPWTATGSQGDPSQAFGSAMTYCTRYFLTNYFQIPQVAAEDVDTYRTKQKAAESSEEKAVADEIIRQFDIAFKTYLSDYPYKSEAMKKFVQRYVKDANYFKIKEPALAAKLLADFKANYLEQKE